MKKITKLLLALTAVLCIGATVRLNSVNADTELSEKSSHKLAPFTPFNLAASDTGYIIKGTTYLGTSETPGSIVVDTPNQRIAFDFGPVGTFITTPTDSYTFNVPNTGGICLIYAGFGWNNLLASFELITSAPGSTEKCAIYNGYTNDSFSCVENVTFNLRQQRIGRSKTPVITEMFAALPAIAGTTCVQGQAYFVADKDTLDIVSERDSYFVLAGSCSTPIPLCPTLYPCGNPCSINCCPAP